MILTPPSTRLRGVLCLIVLLAASSGCTAAMPRVRVADDGRTFAVEGTGERFVPWGFNYDHDEAGRLLEDYWVAEWPKVEQDFAEMRQLGATVVRVHLQTARFMKSPTEPDEAALEQFARLLALAERTGLRLDVTGLGCYHKQDVPAWYDVLDEAGRWAVQARFWEAVAARGARSGAVFCYDLMNEPVVPGGSGRKAGEWLGPPFGGKCFVQFITLTPQGRPRPEIARAWIRQLAAAIRRQDPRGLVTVGLVDWSLDRPGLSSGFVPTEVAGDLDFLCVHLYPEKGKSDEQLQTLAGFAAGKPVVIEETFPLKCGVEEFDRFMAATRKTAAGWIGFYWGKTPAEMRPARTIPDALMFGYLEWFQKNTGAFAER